MTTDLILANGTVIPITGYDKSNLSYFTTTDRDVEDTFEILTKDALKKVTIQTTEIGQVNGEEKEVVSTVGVFTNKVCASATYDGKKSTFNLNDVDKVDLRFENIEASIDDLTLAILMGADNESEGE